MVQEHLVYMQCEKLDACMAEAGSGPMALSA